MLTIDIICIIEQNIYLIEKKKVYLITFYTSILCNVTLNGDEATLEL